MAVFAPPGHNVADVKAIVLTPPKLSLLVDGYFTNAYTVLVQNGHEWQHASTFDLRIDREDCNIPYKKKQFSVIRMEDGNGSWKPIFINAKWRLMEDFVGLFGILSD